MLLNLRVNVYSYRNRPKFLSLPFLPQLVPLSVCSQSNAGQPLFSSSVKFPQDTKDLRKKKKKKNSAHSAIIESLWECVCQAVGKNGIKRKISFPERQEKWLLDCRIESVMFVDSFNI